MDTDQVFLHLSNILAPVTEVQWDQAVWPAYGPGCQENPGVPLSTTRTGQCHHIVVRLVSDHVWNCEEMWSAYIACGLKQNLTSSCTQDNYQSLKLALFSKLQMKSYKIFLSKWMYGRSSSQQYGAVTFRNNSFLWLAVLRFSHLCASFWLAMIKLCSVMT